MERAGGWGGVRRREREIRYHVDKKKSHCTGASDRRVGTTVAMFSGQKEDERDTRTLVLSVCGTEEYARKREREIETVGRRSRIVNLAEVATTRQGRDRGCRRREGQKEQAAGGSERDRVCAPRERWQFIRVPCIVDTYYHAKYNMLTTSHNAGPRSSRFFPVRPFGESRFRAREILLPPVRFGRCGTISASPDPATFDGIGINGLSDAARSGKGEICERIRGNEIP